MSRQLEQNQVKGLVELAEIVEGLTPQDVILSPNPTFTISGTDPLYAEISPIPLVYRIAGTQYSIDSYDPENLGGYAAAGLQRNVLVTLTAGNGFNFIQSAESASPELPNVPTGELLFGRGTITDAGATTQPVTNTLNVIYIAEWGSDSNSGLNQNVPKLTLAGCSGIYTSGWIICLGGGTFAFSQVDSMNYDFRYANFSGNVAIGSVPTIEFLAKEIEGDLSFTNCNFVNTSVRFVGGNFTANKGNISFIDPISIEGNFTYSVGGYTVNGTVNLQGDFICVPGFFGFVNNHAYIKQSGSVIKTEISPTQTTFTSSGGIDYSLYADDENKTVSLTQPDGGSIQLGQELGDLYRNRTNPSVTIINGDICSIVSNPGLQDAVALTDSTSEVLANSTIMMCTVASILHNETGRFTKVGKVRGLNTDAYVEGTVLYVDPANPGKWTATKPAAPNFIVKIGTVSVKHAVNGVVDVHPQLIISEASQVEAENSATTVSNSYISPRRVWQAINKKFTDFVSFAKGFVLTPVVQTSSDPNNSIINGKLGTEIYFKDFLGNVSTLLKSKSPVIYWESKWFTPSGNVSVVGTTVTSVGAQFTATMVTQQAEININGDIRYITGFTSASVATVNEVFSQNWSGITPANWGVYNKKYEILGDNAKYYARNSDATPFNLNLATNTLILYDLQGVTGGYGISNSNGVSLASDRQILYSSTTNQSGAKDLGFKRLIAGWLKVTNGSTGSGAASLSQINLLKNLYQYLATSSDTADTLDDIRLIDTGTYIDLEQCTTAGGSKGIGGWLIRLLRIVKATGLIILKHLAFESTATLTIVAGGTAIASGDLRGQINVQGDSASAPITSIASGSDGQIITIWGNSDTNTVLLANTATNVRLNGNISFTLGQDDNIQLMYRTGTSKWCEISRSNN
jgi:hypothetical protein